MSTCARRPILPALWRKGEPRVTTEFVWDHTSGVATDSYSLAGWTSRPRCLVYFRRVRTLTCDHHRHGEEDTSEGVMQHGVPGEMVSVQFGEHAPECFAPCACHAVIVGREPRQVAARVSTSDSEVGSRVRRPRDTRSSVAAACEWRCVSRSLSEGVSAVRRREGAHFDEHSRACVVGAPVVFPGFRPIHSKRTFSGAMQPPDISCPGHRIRSS